MAREPFKTPFFEVLFTLDQLPVAPRKQRTPRMPPMKVGMLLHFYAVVGPYAPEESRTSRAYTQFVRELLRDGLIERPTNEQRATYPGWAYRCTPKGDALVNAICSTPMPVERTRWVMPS